MDDATKDLLLWGCFIFSGVQALGVILSFFGVTWDSLWSGSVKSETKSHRVPPILVTGCLSSAAAGFCLLLYGKHHPVWMAGVISIAVILIVIVWKYESRTHTGLLPQASSGQWKPKWQRLQWANAERERLEGEVRKWKDMYESLQKQPAKAEGNTHPIVTALQLEILQLSRDLQTLLRDAGPRPTLENTGPMKRGEDVKTWTQQRTVEADAWMEANGQWSRKFIYNYREHFAGRVKRLMNSLGATGRVVVSLEPYTNDIRPGDDFDQLISILMDFFVQLENPKPPKPRPALSVAMPVVPTLLSPLQSDAIQLSGELLDFLRRIGSPPAPKYTAEDIDKMTSAQMKTLINANDGDFLEAVEYYRPGEIAFTREGLENQLTSKWTRLLPWYQKLEATYSLEGFKDKVERLRNRFLLEGITDNVFLMPIEGKHGVERIRNIASKLWELAYKTGEKGIP